MGVIDLFKAHHLADKNTSIVRPTNASILNQKYAWENERNITLHRVKFPRERDVCINQSILIDFKHADGL